MEKLQGGTNGKKPAQIKGIALVSARTVVFIIRGELIAKYQLQFRICAPTDNFGIQKNGKGIIYIREYIILFDEMTEMKGQDTGIYAQRRHNIILKLNTTFSATTSVYCSERKLL